MQTSKQYIATGLATIAGGLLALASLLTTMMAVHFNAEALADPMLVLNLPGVSTLLVRWSMLFDMLGYYLFLLPLIFLLRRQLQPDTLLSKLGAFCGTAYVLTGATGAAILSVVWPYIIATYHTADPQTKTVLAANFRAFNMMVYEGMWNLLEMIFAAAWWVITALLLYRKGFLLFGIFTAVLGVSCLANAASVMFAIDALHQAALNVYLFLSILWAIITGVSVLRRRPLSVAQNNVLTAGRQSSKRSAFARP